MAIPVLLLAAVVHGVPAFSSSVQPVLFVQAGSNFSIPCAAAEEMGKDGKVTSVEWSCLGCAPQGSKEDRVRLRLPVPVRLIERRSNATRLLLHGAGRLSLGESSFRLHFQQAHPGDAGLYSCAANNVTPPSRGIRVIVQDVPDPPGRPLVVSFTSRSANLSWAPGRNSGNSPVTHYVIGVREGEDGSWDREREVSAETNATRYSVSGLLPFTVYSFRLFSVNGIGRSRPSPESYYMITLREVPSGKPTIVYANNASSSAIRLEWEVPPPGTLHGEFLAYRITYRPHGEVDIVVSSADVPDFETTSYTLEGLRTFTHYWISLQVLNPEGLGPAEVVVVDTDEGVPEEPRNVTVLDVTSSSVLLRWTEPLHSNGVILGYRVRYTHGNHTDILTVKPPTRATLSGLQPFTVYRVSIAAFTWKHEGETSKPIALQTDVAYPGVPIVEEISCNSSTSFHVKWADPDGYNGNIDKYYIRFLQEDSENWQEEMFLVDDPKDNHEVVIANLTAESSYLVKLQAAVRSVVNSSHVYRGMFTEERRVFVDRGCSSAYRGGSGGDSRLPGEDGFAEVRVAILAGASCSFALLLIIAAIIIICRKCAWKSYYSFKDSSNLLSSTPGWMDAKDSVTSVPSFLFPAHVAHLHADGNMGFAKEFANLQLLSPSGSFSSNFAQTPENKNKNRYTNIIAYDHTRVLLEPDNSKSSFTDYINANFIDGFMHPKAYIATQGPLTSTMESFWKMVWDYEVEVIIMITNLIENGRKKCDMYWPSDGCEEYGAVKVKLLKEVELATYTVREFQICRKKKIVRKNGRANQKVVQFHFTNWPDHGIPDHTLPILNFVRLSSSRRQSRCSPIVVHCSAGVGRTGTYVVLDTMLRQAASENRLNVVSYLQHIRTQRNFLVQTEEQYVFIHDVLLEALLSGDTHVRAEDLSAYIRSLQGIECNETGFADCTRLEEQYKLVTSWDKGAREFEEAGKPFNVAKNRRMDLLPVDSYRVHLNGKPGIQGSTYINASWFPGYQKMKEFIVTQHPLPSTILDFWQMVFDNSVQAIVLVAEAVSNEFPVFWPQKHRPICCGDFSIHCVEDGEASPGHFSKEFLVQSVKEDHEFSVRLTWVGATEPKAARLRSAAEIAFATRRSRGDYQNGPTVVVDRFGGEEAAAYACLSTLARQLDAEGAVNVYSCAKLYHLRRPGIWSSIEDYLFLYATARSLSSAPEKASLLPLRPSRNGYVRASRCDDNVFVDSAGGDPFDDGRPPSDFFPVDARVAAAWQAEGGGGGGKFSRIPPEGRESYLPVA